MGSSLVYFCTGGALGLAGSSSSSEMTTTSAAGRPRGVEVLAGGAVGGAAAAAGAAEGGDEGCRPAPLPSDVRGRERLFRFISLRPFSNSLSIKIKTTNLCCALFRSSLFPLWMHSFPSSPYSPLVSFPFLVPPTPPRAPPPPSPSQNICDAVCGSSDDTLVMRMNESSLSGMEEHELARTPLQDT